MGSASAVLGTVAASASMVGVASWTATVGKNGIRGGVEAPYLEFSFK